jgi:Phosphotransferase enzyme family
MTPTFREPDPAAAEVPLLGGDVTEGLVRVGDTVRRPPGPHSVPVRHLLLHLERAGFTAAPRWLGIDAKGRDVLTFVPGEMGGRPIHPWAAGEELLVGIARLQRRLHDACEGFTLPDGVRWPERPPVPEAPMPFAAPELVCHNDLTVENVICRDGLPVGFIDFDLAGPTTRLFDIVTTLRYWAPMSPPADRDPAFRDLDAGRRIRLFCDAYGLDDARRADFLGMADRRWHRSYHAMKRAAVERGGGWARMWAEGVGDQILRDRAWARENAADLRP